MDAQIRLGKIKEHHRLRARVSAKKLGEMVQTDHMSVCTECGLAVKQSKAVCPVFHNNLHLRSLQVQLTNDAVRDFEEMFNSIDGHDSPTRPSYVSNQFLKTFFSLFAHPYRGSYRKEFLKINFQRRPIQNSVPSVVMI